MRHVLFVNLDMVVVIKKGSTKAEVDAAFEKLAKHREKVRNPFDAKKFAGKLKLDIDAITYQRQLRDEWE